MASIVRFGQNPGKMVMETEMLRYRALQMYRYTDISVLYTLHLVLLLWMIDESQRISKRAMSDIPPQGLAGASYEALSPFFYREAVSYPARSVIHQRKASLRMHRRQTSCETFAEEKVFDCYRYPGIC